MFKKNISLAIGLIAGVFILMSAPVSNAAESSKDKHKIVNIYKPGADKSTRTLSNISNWSYWIYHTGKSALDPNGNSGGIYPRGTAGVIFQDGIVWGGYVRDPGTMIPLRVGGQTYNIGTTPGWIKEDGTAVPADDPRARIYRIRSDWETLTVEQVRQDAGELNQKRAEDVTEAEAQAVIDQYALDWNEWPVDLGAPIDENGNPGIADADQVIWFVVNDLTEANTLNLYGSPPIGIELQITMWAYNQPTSTLGQLLFKKFKFINRSGFFIDSMFVCQWSDPDLGSAADDLAGCDIERSLGYAYNGFRTDGDFTAFGLAPAAVGYDFFQGPVVQGVAGEDKNMNGIDDAEDSAVFDLKRKEGFINLPMTSFFFFAAGSPISDPDLGDYESTKEFYNMLNGFTPTNDLNNPTPYIVGSGPSAGEATKFPLSGDPFFGTGDLDATGGNLPAGDRRLGLVSGPFTMAPGDTQEVVVAVVGGIILQPGGDNRNAVAQLKLNDDFAQFIYNNLFQGIPKPPSNPIVKTTPLESKIVLNWGFDAARVEDTEKDDPILGFDFEGYNVYQLPGPSSSKDQAKLIATFDKVNGIQIIRAKQFLASFGDVVEIPVQKGTDSGLQRYFVLEKDYINDQPLYAGNTYYFAVTAYNYNDDPTVPEPTLESPLSGIAVIPQPNLPGVRYEGTPGSDVTVNHPLGASDGIVHVSVIDPAAVNGHQYKVFFTEDTDTNSATFGELFWNVMDMTDNKMVVENQLQVASLEETQTQPIFDGIQVKVTGPALNFKNFETVANANGVLDPPDGAAADFQDFPSLRPSDAQQVGDGHWMIHTGEAPDGSRGSYSAFISRVTQGGARWPLIIPNDFEIRFKPGGKGLIPGAFGTGPQALIDMPFELWNIGSGTPDDPSDDYRLFPYVLDVDENGAYNLLDQPTLDALGFGDRADHSASGADNDPYTDWFYWVIPEDESPGESGYNTLLSLIEADVSGYSFQDGSNGDVIRRMVLLNWNGGDVEAGVYNQDMPEDGTVFRISSTKPNTLIDEFAFTAPTTTFSTATAKSDVDKVNVFPNPYYAFNPSEPNRFERFVTINHLPQLATVRIFTLTGIQVRKLVKNDNSQFLRWNLTNESDIPVASGIYIAHVDMPALGETKVLKIFIIMSQEMLKFY